MIDGGWIPYDGRDKSGQRFTDEFHEQCSTFSRVAGTIGASEPERVSIDELYFKSTGKTLPRIFQTTGSCVGAGSGNCAIKAAFADRHFRGDLEDVKLPCFLPTYGVGRKLAGMRGRGSGSYGAAQAKAISPEHFGMLPIDHSRMPQPSFRNGWVKYGKNTELEWSYSPRFPISVSDLRAEAKKYGIHSITRIKSASEARQALAQGYPLTFASSFGARPQVRGDVLLGPRSGSWAHQMSGDGYWQHPRHGLIFKCDNQWGRDAHGSCPTMSKWGVYGSFWIPSKDFDWICRTGEVYAHSNTGGFPTREIAWDFTSLLR